MTTRAKKTKNKGEISVRGPTYDRLRDYCRRHGVQMKSVVDDLLIKALDEQENKN